MRHTSAKIRYSAGWSARARVNQLTSKQMGGRTVCREGLNLQRSSRSRKLWTRTGAMSPPLGLPHYAVQLPLLRPALSQVHPQPRQLRAPPGLTGRKQALAAVGQAGVVGAQLQQGRREGWEGRVGEGLLGWRVQA